MNGRLALGHPLVVHFVDENSGNLNISYMSPYIVRKRTKFATIQNKLKSMVQATSISPMSPSYFVE